MNEKRIRVEAEEPKHKKKSRRKGLPRADHKHEYKTVLLTEHYFDSECVTATKVCQICGRIGDRDRSRYEAVEVEDPGLYSMRSLRIKSPEKLDQWDFELGEKFAHKTSGGE